MQSNEPAARIGHLAPVELLVLQGTPFCNLNCTYCDLSSASRRQNHKMPLQLIERTISELFASGVPLAPEITIIWHSGEPLTLPPAYYDAAIDRVFTVSNARAAQPVAFRFEIQTNGVLINKAWCDFFARHAAHLQVGVSCDGPVAMHDAFRVNWSTKASHARTVRGMDLLAAYGIRYKAIAVVTKRTLADPESFFTFFQQRRHALRDFHFNVLAEGTGAEADLAYSAADRDQYYRFYRRLIDLCRTYSDRGTGFGILNFAQGLSRILSGAGAEAEACALPLKSLSVDARGNITTFYAGLAPETQADHYGDGQGLALGNILTTPLAEMVRSPKLARMVTDFAASRAVCRAECAYHAVCPGGFELTKLARHGRYDAGETPECVIHVQTLTDALLEDVSEHLAAQRKETVHA